MSSCKPALILVGALVVLGGCSDDPLGRRAISGTVKVDGTALANGDISFQPVEGQATSAGDRITEGKFSVPRDKGLAPGKYRVEVHAPTPGTGAQIDESALPGDIPAPPKELIPPEWNTASTQTIDVRKQGPFVFDFDIPTKKGSAKSKP